MSKFDENELKNKPFMMAIAEVLHIENRGTVVIGRVQTGTVQAGDTIEIKGKGRPSILTTITSFEGFMRDPDNWVAWPGDNTAILLHEVEVDQLEPGMIITLPKF